MKHATHLTTRLLVTGALLGASSAALADVSANVGVTSNYVWRGVTQTDNQAAIQGGVDYAHESGVYLGAWASNVDFGPGATGYELDLYGGYGGSINDFGYDVGLLYYTYTDSDDANFLELGLSGSYKMVTIGVNYTIDGQADDDAAFAEGDLYYYGSLSFDLPQDFGLGLTVGKYEFDDTADTEYVHWQIDLSKSAGDFGDVTFSVAGAEDDAGNPNGDDPILFVSWAKSF